MIDEAGLVVHRTMDLRVVVDPLVPLTFGEPDDAIRVTLSRGLLLSGAARLPDRLPARRNATLRRVSRPAEPKRGSRGGRAQESATHSRGGGSVGSIAALVKKAVS
jgi:hypothetical protein